MGTPLITLAKASARATNWTNSAEPKFTFRSKRTSQVGMSHQMSSKMSAMPF